MSPDLSRSSPAGPLVSEGGQRAIASEEAAKAASEQARLQAARTLAQKGTAVPETRSGEAVRAATSGSARCGSSQGPWRERVRPLVETFCVQMPGSHGVSAAVHECLHVQSEPSTYRASRNGLPSRAAAGDGPTLSGDVCTAPQPRDADPQHTPGVEHEPNYSIPGSSTGDGWLPRLPSSQLKPAQRQMVTQAWERHRPEVARR